MYLFIIITGILILPSPTNPKREEVTLNVHERIALLKQKIEQEIKENQRQSKPWQISRQLPIDKSDEFTDNYEYVETDNQPVTPIMDFDYRKEKDRYKFKQIKTTTTSTTPTIVGEPLRTKRKKNKKTIALKPKDIFYRRVFNPSMMNTKVEWTHCQDLITPFFVGHKVDIDKPKHVSSKDNVVLRLVQLLSANTTGFSKDDIYSIMYQISNLQLRLFQWDVSAMRMLLNTIIRGKNRSFKSLKNGLKSIFASWHLDIGNITNLLKQARIFRPPCVKITDHDGSTKRPKAHRFPTKATTKKTCPPNEYNNDDECVKITIKY